MTQRDQGIRRHYGQPDLSRKILEALAANGKNVERLTRDDLRPLEEFHTRGREATRELARLAGTREGMQVLDLGCGIGGAARTLAAEFGCQVMGIDLVDEYCEVAVMLSARVGIDEQTIFRAGDITALPVANQSCDQVWTQHVLMNVPDKTVVLCEVERVLRPGGKYAWFEILAGDGGEPYYPVPWAADTTISFLITPEEFRQAIAQAGLQVAVWLDQTDSAAVWFEKMLGAARQRPEGAPAPAGLGLLMGSMYGQKVENMHRNLAQGRIRAVMGVAEKAM